MTNRYNASQIIERALNLADIGNSSFLTYEEQKRYLNDAWTTVYQALINKGDHQFVVEAELVGIGSSTVGFTEFEVPDDLFMISSIRDVRGFVFTRHSQSEGDGAAGTYDIVNRRIRIYGSHYSKVILTYWKTPTYLSFPDKDIEWDNTNKIVDSCLNSVLLDNGDIYNVVDGSLVASVTLAEGADYWLGDGVIVEKTEDEEGDVSYAVKNFNGDVFNDFQADTVNFFKDRNGAIMYQTLEDAKYSSPKLAINGEEQLTIDEYEESGYPIYISSDYYRGNWIYYKPMERVLVVYDEESESTFEIPGFSTASITWAEDFDNKPAFYLTSLKNDVYLVTYDDNGNVEYDKLGFKPAIVQARLRYGILESNGTHSTLRSVVPDTEMNFPNNLYFSLLSCDLALRYVMKMNADSTGLDNLYQNMWNELKNQLDQSGSYHRIKIV